jgi:hypothetical protein
VPDFVSDAKKVPVAAEFVRAILRWQPSIRGELRELLWQIDNGDGVNVDAVPDPELRSALRGLFSNLNLRHTRQVHPPRAPSVTLPAPAVHRLHVA